MRLCLGCGQRLAVLERDSGQVSHHRKQPPLVAGSSEYPSDAEHADQPLPEEHRRGNREFLILPMSAGHPRLPCRHHLPLRSPADKPLAGSQFNAVSTVRSVSCFEADPVLFRIKEVEFDAVGIQDILGKPDDRGHGLVERKGRIELLNRLGNADDKIEIFLVQLPELLDLPLQLVSPGLGDRQPFLV